ncbi:hypothetical protein HQN60_06890 [Deefgea piscis]|uniref:DUF485 domain-containing protein n=1 Tax=Deefgea piscis TaxID=2739061 RepID=A0A6M8SMS6_9NEIS|nr:hypothetical protein [Deefgea piscis]QKJ66443.1 hypothetical protein HQN60_06890 [Deefgea piscis]
MLQRRSFVQRVLYRLRQLLLSLAGFFLLQYLLFVLPQALGNNLTLSGAMLPILLLILFAYAAAALLVIRNVWRG